MATDLLFSQTKTQMQSIIEHLLKEYKSLRTGRVNSRILDELKVDCYGSFMSLVSMAQINLKDRDLIITPYDKQMLKSIYQALEKSEFSKFPRLLEKEYIRFSVPAMTEEVRKDVVKMAKKMSEEAKITIRDVRRKSNDLLKKSKELPEDEVKKAEKQIQELTDKFCADIDRLFLEKEKDILTI